MTPSTEPGLPQRGRFQMGGVALADILAAIVGAGWIVVPAVQYLGAYHRASTILSPENSIEWLVTLDLTPWYVALLAASLLLLGVRILHRGREMSSDESDTGA